MECKLRSITLENGNDLSRCDCGGWWFEIEGKLTLANCQVVDSSFREHLDRAGVLTRAEREHEYNERKEVLEFLKLYLNGGFRPPHERTRY